MNPLEKLSEFNGKWDRLEKERGRVNDKFTDLRKAMRKAGLSPPILEECRRLLGMEMAERDTKRTMIEQYLIQLGETPLELAAKRREEAEEAALAAAGTDTPGEPALPAEGPEIAGKARKKRNGEPAPSRKRVKGEPLRAAPGHIPAVPARSDPIAPGVPPDIVA